MLRIEKREASHIGRQKAVCVVLAIVVAGSVIAVCGYNPFIVYREMLVGALSSPYYIQQTIQKAIPLLIMGLGVAVCFKMIFINIGAEGQFYMGAIAATYVALHAEHIPIPAAWLLMFLAAFLAGGIWCLAAGILKAKWNVSETLVTLMMNYIAAKLVTYLQYVLWKDPKSFGFPKIANYPDALQLPSVLGLHAGWIIATALVVFTYLLQNHLRIGYEISVMGANRNTARYAGINTTRILLVACLIGGGMCGLSGLIQASGVERTLNDQMCGGLGYTAIAVSYMAQMKPVSIVIVSLLFAVLLQGGSYMQVSMQIPSTAGEVIEGIILLFILGGEFFYSYRITKHNRGRAEA